MPSMPVLYIAQALQGAVMFTLMAWAGLALGRRVGLDAPRLRAWIARNPQSAPALPWRLIGLGAVAACVAVLLLEQSSHAWMPPPIAAEPPHPGAVQGFLASFYGAIGEELQLRLFVMTLFAWLLLKAGLGRGTALVAANVVAALVFGAGHLPMAAQIWPLTAAVVAYIVSANAIAGVIFGALYARHGLEAAIVAHFITDLGLHVLPPLLAAA
jgi:hypothetical protein